MPSRSAVYAQAKKHAEIERSVIEALAKRAADQQRRCRLRKAEDILPTDLWMRVLGSLDDCNLLWSSCLHVCQSFRQCVETIFADDHIRDSKTLITFDLGEDPTGDRKRQVGVELAFDKFSDDGSRAIFKEAEGDLRNQELEKATTERWKSVMQDKSGNDCADSHTIAVRRFVNDTELPGLEIDYEKRTISFDWRAMYTCFFREEDWVEKQQALWAHSNLALSHRTQRRIAAKEIDEMAAVTAIFDRLEDVYNAARRDIRRHRISKYHAQGWTQERCTREAVKLRRMREARAMASFLQFSDEESE